MTAAEAIIAYRKIDNWLQASEVYDESGYYRLRQADIATGTCTWTAAIFTWLLGGQVCGYAAAEEIGARIGCALGEGGHDFALVDGQFIMDWWVNNVFDPNIGPFYQIPQQWGEVRMLYGDPSQWDCREFGEDEWPIEALVDAEYTREKLKKEIGL
jgi:hypothetical protein